jgi:hypothetical protein
MDAATMETDMTDYVGSLPETHPFASPEAAETWLSANGFTETGREGVWWSTKRGRRATTTSLVDGITLVITTGLYAGAAVRLLEEWTTNAAVTGGVVRWNSTNRVPPTDVLDLWRHAGKGFDYDKSLAAQADDLTAFLAEYRASDTGPSDEERAEARAAHGPGHTLVNVVTGTKWTT